MSKNQSKKLTCIYCRAESRTPTAAGEGKAGAAGTCTTSGGYINMSWETIRDSSLHKAQLEILATDLYLALYRLLSPLAEKTWVPMKTSNIRNVYSCIHFSAGRKVYLRTFGILYLERRGDSLVNEAFQDWATNLPNTYYLVDVWKYRRNPWIVIDVLLRRERKNVVNQREDLQEMTGQIAPAGLYTVLNQAPQYDLRAEYTSTSGPPSPSRTANTCQVGKYLSMLSQNTGLLGGILSSVMIH
ncbi:hypothetical protein B0H14DRAFT_3489950 [Mycena olivaceomarginata]|nr:hypothetical protein B0H14DRAFT_3489950 [Mycena olivaceomarginata]